MIIRPRYIGMLVREEPLCDYIMHEFDHAKELCDMYTKNGDLKLASLMLGKMEALKDLHSYLIKMEKY